MLFEPRTAFVVGLSVVVGLSIPIQAQNSSQEQEQPTTAEASAPVILLEFSASKVPDGDAITAFLDMAADPRVSRLEVSGLFGSIGTVDGTLVFQSPDAFSRWRENGMEPFFQPVGGMSAVDATLRGFRPALLAKSQPRKGRVRRSREFLLATETRAMIRRVTPTSMPSP